MGPRNLQERQVAASLAGRTRIAGATTADELWRGCGKPIRVQVRARPHPQSGKPGFSIRSNQGACIWVPSRKAAEQIRRALLEADRAVRVVFNCYVDIQQARDAQRAAEAAIDSALSEAA